MSGSSSDGVKVGGIADMVSRIRAVMPASWFPITAPDAEASATPVLDGLLSGVGQAWSFCYALILFVRQQTRIATATGGFLNMICIDLFGDVLKRGMDEADVAFRSRIEANLLLPRATRSALSQALLTFLGQSPIVFEPFKATDTGGYGGISSATAGGGGGYGSPALAFGSLSMPFQFLIALTGTTGSILRESVATFIDVNGLMQIASRHVLRPIFKDREVAGSLVEMRSFNLIKDSLGWTGLSLPALDGTATWAIDTTGADALLETHSTLQMRISEAGSFIGPAVMVPLVAGPVIASLWIKISLVSGLSSLEIVLVDQIQENQASIDLSVVNSWQRVSVSSFVPDTFTRPITLQLVGRSSAGTISPIVTQCWQIEPGLVASSYIPSSRQIGIREADDQIRTQAGSTSAVDQHGLNQVISRVIPAGSTAWTTPTF